MVLAIVYYSLSLLGIVRKKSRVLTFLMMLVMWIVFGLCTYNGDFGNYRWIYQNIQNRAYWIEFEPLFTIMMYICSNFGLDFIQFRMIFGAAFIILLYITIGKYTMNKAEVLGLYMLFPFLLFTSVIRSGFANILIVLGYYELTGGRNNRWKFWLLISIATLIQYTSIFFAIFYFFRKNHFKRNSLLLSFVVVVVAFATYYTGILYHIVSVFTSNYRTLKWFNPSAINQEFRWAMYLVAINVMLLFVILISRYENFMMSESGGKINEYAEDIFSINIFMLIFIPTYFVTNASARFVWEILLLDFICYAKDDECRIKANSWRRISKKTIIIMAFILFCSFYANLPYRGTLNDAKLVFQNNLIYGK